MAKPYDAKLPEAAELSKMKSPKRRVKDSSVLNMAVYDIEDARIIRQAVHENYLQSYANPHALIASFEALTQFWIMFKFVISKGQRKKMDEFLKSYASELSSLEATLANGKRIPMQDYAKIRRKMSGLIEKIYMLKQNSGLGIPTERVRDSEFMLDEATK